MNDATPAPEPMDLEGFFRRVASVNPFTDNRITGPSARAVDVADIHQGAFERLTDLAREAHEGRRGLGAMLRGEAGIGKSHLLARLEHWAAQDEHACFVYLHNLQAAPEHLPRSLLRAVISILTLGRRRHLVGTPLFHLAHGGVLEAVHYDRRYYSWDYLDQAYATFLDQLALPGSGGPALLDRTPYEVLFRFFRSACEARKGREDGRTAELAVRWLSGEALDPDEARLLDLPGGRQRDEPVALEDNQQVKQVLVCLARLSAGRGRPLVLAFDQVDNLDADQMAALARFLEALLDSAPNLLVVTAGIKATLLRWHEQGVIQSSAWDRLAHFPIDLQRLTAAQALEIVRGRVDDFLAPFAGVESVRRRRVDDPLFPLGRAWQERYLGDKVDLRPRDAINWAREGWRQQQEALARQGGPAWLDAWPGEEEPPLPLKREWTGEEIQAAIDRKIDEKMAGHWAWRMREQQGLPPDADHLVGLLYGLLVPLRDAGSLGVLEVERVPPPRRNARPTYDLDVLQRGPDGVPAHTGVRVVTTESARSVTGFLKRLVEDARPLDRLLLVTDERVGLPLGEKGHEYLSELKQARVPRFRVLELTFAEYVDLDALAEMTRLARGGDLETEQGPVTEAEVLASHQRRGRYRASRLLREILEAAAEPVRETSTLGNGPQK